MAQNESNIAVDLRGISKHFGTFVANDDISISIMKGEVHALLGENGAGKTTLMKALYGMHRPTSGKIFLWGKEVDVTDPKVAISLGIGMVHQHFMLVRPFTVTQNIILGMEPTGLFGAIDFLQSRKRVEELSKKYGLLVDPDALIEDISVGMEQRVEILKALYRGAEILILDEPTAVLTPQEIDDLMGIIRNLTVEGKTVIIITHKLKEIKHIADRCTIIRRGKKIDTVRVHDVTEQDLARMMVGREVNFDVPRGPFNPGTVALEVRKVSSLDGRGLPALKDLSFTLQKGEILAIAGVDGNGQTELAEVLTGLRNLVSGNIFLRNEDIKNLTTKDIIRKGLVAIPQDRQKFGLVLEFSVSENIILQEYDKPTFSRNGILLNDAIHDYSAELIEKFDVRPPVPEYKASELSGGNQQKVIIAREVSQNPDVLIANQPTRGLDVGAIEFVHRALIEQRDRGKAVLLISLELDEVLGLADRILVLYEGKIVGELEAAQADEQKVGILMAGGQL
ncbi:MAG: ABC transporter ATP-binding protein [Spirochaetales bacterium]|nr:ABC transporter ATP-binding protein [Spirochaetales bacterium]